MIFILTTVVVEFYLIYLICFLCSFQTDLTNDVDLWLNLDSPGKPNEVKDEPKASVEHHQGEERKSKKSKKKNKESERSCECTKLSKTTSSPFLRRLDVFMA